MDKIILVQTEPRGPSMMVEIPVTQAGAQRVPFPDVPQLRSTMNQKVVIKGFRLIIPDVLTNAPLSGNANAPVTESQKITATFYVEGWEKAQQVALLEMNDMQLLGGTAPNAPNTFMVNDWINLDWPKCFLQFSNGTGSAGVPYSVLIDVFYEKYDAQNNVIKSAS